MLKHLFRRPPFEREAHDLYVALVQQARRPVFYQEMGIPDTPEGRFELVVLHAFLLISRLNAEIGKTRELSQQVFDVWFGDMDSALRELGIGDIGVGKRVKRMVESFYGRATAYETGLKSKDEALQAAFARNIFAHKEPSPGVLEALDGYVRAQRSALQAVELDTLMRGQLVFNDVEPVIRENSS
ncbi:MAG TPA: ubiquinol-cytochrome C chaperone [Sneathiellales bacterium]|nr:ubiquinol-cytochrome C chaperone [Sneathiellales bacterium]